MELSKLRQKIHRFNTERTKLLQRVVRPGKMILGSLYQISRCCGNPNCKCAKGEKHISWYLSRGVEGKTKLTYIGRIVPDRINERVKRYQNHQRLLAKIRKIDTDISTMLNKLRDVMVQSIDVAREERKDK